MIIQLNTIRTAGKTIFYLSTLWKIKTKKKLKEEFLLS